MHVFAVKDTAWKARFRTVWSDWRHAIPIEERGFSFTNAIQLHHISSCKYAFSCYYFITLHKGEFLRVKGISPKRSWLGSARCRRRERDIVLVRRP
jgi:hypothetical protein